MHKYWAIRVYSNSEQAPYGPFRTKSATRKYILEHSGRGHIKWMVVEMSPIEICTTAVEWKAA